jgi:hypothetical protein
MNELAKRARAQLTHKTWHEVRKDLHDHGVTDEELDSLVDILFPGKKRRDWLWGLVGAGVGILFWALFLKR